MRRLQAATGITGMDVNEIANLQATAAGFAARGGGGQELGVGGGIYAAATVKSLEGRFQGSGVTKGEVSQMAAALYGGAASSQVGQQFAAASRIGEMYGGFDKGTEAEAMYKAIQSGQETYTWKGQQKNTFMRDEGEWRRIMSQGLGGELSPAEIASMRRDRATNEMFLSEKGIMAAQRSQYQVDIEPNLRRMVASRTGTKNEARAKGLTESVWGVISDFQSDPDKSVGGNFVKLRDELRDKLRASGVRDANIVATQILSDANRLAGRIGHENVIAMGMVHGGGGKREAMEEALATTDAKAALSKATSHLGRTGWMKNLFEAVQGATGDTDWKELVAAAGGMVKAEDVQKSFEQVAKDISESDEYTTEQKERMLEVVRGQSKKAAIEKRLGAELDRRVAIAKAMHRGMSPEEAEASVGRGTDGDRDDLAGRSREITIRGDLILKADGKTVTLIGKSGGEGYDTTGGE
jgi:hypothetical protein